MSSVGCNRQHKGVKMACYCNSCVECNVRRGLCAKCGESVKDGRLCSSCYDTCECGVTKSASSQLCCGCLTGIATTPRCAQKNFKKVKRQLFPMFGPRKPAPMGVVYVDSD